MKPTHHLHPKHPGQGDDYDYDSPELGCPCRDGSVPVSVLLATLPAVRRRMAQVIRCFAASRDPPAGLDAARGASALAVVASSSGRPVPSSDNDPTAIGGGRMR